MTYDATRLERRSLISHALYLMITGILRKYGLDENTTENTIRLKLNRSSFQQR